MDDKLRNESIPKLMLRFAIPAVIASLVVVMYSVIDKIFIGQLIGAEALAGVTLIFPLNLIAISVSAIVGVGSSVVIAIKMGEGDKKKGRRAVGTQISMFFIVCIAVIILEEIFLGVFLRSTSKVEEIIPYAMAYGRITIPVLLFQCFSFGISGTIRVFGFPKYAMAMSIVGALVNIVLDYVFIAIVPMGVFGAGLATLLANVVAAIMAWRFFTSGGYIKKIRIKDLNLDKEIVVSILKSGFPMGIIQIAGAIVASLYNVQLSRFQMAGAVTAYGIVNTVHMVNVNVISAVINGGMQPILSYNYGAGNRDRMKSTIKITAQVVILLSFIFMAGIQIFPEAILKLFTHDTTTLGVGVGALRCSFSVLPVTVLTVMISGVYLSIRRNKRAMLFNIMRKIVFIAPAVMILPGTIGLNGIWFSRPVADMISLVIMMIFIKIDISKEREYAAQEYGAL